MGFYISADRGVHGGKLACHRPANRFRYRLPGVSCRSRLPNGALGLCSRVPRQVAGLPKRLLHRAGRCHACVAVVHWGTLEGPGEQVAQAVIIGALCVLILLATFVMSLLLDYRQQDELTRRFEMENRELSSALYREIAREFKLSDWELQIMALLAEGYSRTYIRDSYCCSHCKRA